MPVVDFILHIKKLFFVIWMFPIITSLVPVWMLFHWSLDILGTVNFVEDFLTVTYWT